MSEYKIINANQISREKWWEFTDNTENCNIFSTPYMYDVWNSTPGYKPFAFFAMDDNEEINGILTGYLETVSKGILSKISTRAVLMQSPVAIDDEALSSLLKHYLTFMKRKAVYTEIRNNFDTSFQKDIYESFGFHYEEHLNIIIDVTPSEDELFGKMHSSRKRNIRKAIKNGILVKEIDHTEFDKVYNILLQIYKRIRLPLPAYNHFLYGYKLNNSKSKMIIYGAYFNKTLIGTMITLKYKNLVIGYYGGSLNDYYNIRPNDILTWDILITIKKEGYKYFDFGGAGKPNVPYGVRDYKMEYGGKLVNHGRYYYNSKILFKIAEIGFKSIQTIKGFKSNLLKIFEIK